MENRKFRAAGNQAPKYTMVQAIERIEFSDTGAGTGEEARRRAIKRNHSTAQGPIDAR